MKGGESVRFYSAKIKLESWPRLRTFALRVTDKRVAEEKLRQMVIEFEREDVGIIAPRQMRDGVNKPLGDHLAVFLADLTGRGRSANTLKRYRKSMVRTFKLCRWSKLSDITPRSFSEWRGQAKLAPKYVNDLLGILSTFLNWLERERVIMENPLRHAGKARVVEGEGYRRALSPDELQRLVNAAPPVRAAVYLFIAYTGLRRCEMNLLKWENLDLESIEPTVSLPAAITKNRKQAKLPLVPPAVAALRQLRPDLAMSYEWVFRGKVPSPRALRLDLTAAKIPHVDERGRVLDIHALRKTLGTMLGVLGVPPRVHMALMRHSDIRLTMREYTDEHQLPMREAMLRLPAISLPAEYTQKDTSGAGFPRENETRPDASREFLAENQTSVSVTARHKKTGLESTRPASQMVGAERFEVSSVRPDVSNNHKHNKGNQMTDTQKNNSALVVDLKRRLAETEDARRELLVSALFNYAGDSGEIVRLLISQAAPETLRTLENMLTSGSEG